MFPPNATAVPSQFLPWTQATASQANHFQPGQATMGPADRPKHVSVSRAKTSAMSGNAAS